MHRCSMKKNLHPLINVSKTGEDQGQEEEEEEEADEKKWWEPYNFLRPLSIC